MLPVLETTAHSPLTIVWFVLITVLWVGFFFLEGFDFGVAMLLPFLGRDDKDRRLMVNTIGPTWDGNEVWLLTAGGATFAAFLAGRWVAGMAAGALAGIVSGSGPTCAFLCEDARAAREVAAELSLSGNTAVTSGPARGAHLKGE